jgi:hypothetical protein
MVEASNYEVASKLSNRVEASLAERDHKQKGRRSALSAENDLT